MKSKTLLVSLVSLASLSSLMGCAKNSSSASSYNISAIKELAFNANFNTSKNLGNVDDVFNSLIDAIKTGGKTFINGQIGDLIKMGFAAILNDLGYDTRSIEQKKLDQISEQLKELQNIVVQGLESIKRQQIHIRNEEVMDKLLDKINEVSGPVSSAVKTLNIISQKEISGEYDESVLVGERTRFAKDVDELRFTTLTANKVWFSCKLLAEAIMKPSPTNSSITLWSLYEDTYGALETWDYMTIEPRINFISYLGFLVNSFAELCKSAADYEISLLPEGDANINTITDGVKQMVESVNNLNEQFQTEIIKLENIKKKHDDEHIITKRNRGYDEQGNIVVTDGTSLSTRLMSVTPNDNEYNYIIYNHDQGARYHDSGGGQYYYESYVYNLDAATSMELYETIFEEYYAYNSATGHDNYTDFTIKDYLATIGFYSQEEEYYKASEGFYIGIGDVSGSRSGGWKNTYNDLFIGYDDFQTRSYNYKVFSEVGQYEDWIWSSTEWKHWTDLDHYYLTFLEPDQKTLVGDMSTTIVSQGALKNVNSETWERHYKGNKKWTRDSGTKIVISQ